MESSHSPNPRRHWNLCSTKPLQNTSLSSDSIDLRNREKEEGEKKEGDGGLIRSPFSRENSVFSLMYCKYSLRCWGKETITIKNNEKPGSVRTHAEMGHTSNTSMQLIKVVFPNYSILKHSCVSLWQGGVKG